MTRAMATAIKRVMETNGNTTGSGYHCPSSSAVAAAAVGKDDKGGGSLFLYVVVVKKNGLCIFSILMFGKEAVCPDCLFVPVVFGEPGFYLNSLKCAFILDPMKFTIFLFPVKLVD
jgi:hypothetical protein